MDISPPCHQVAVGLGTSSPIQATQGSPVRGKTFKGRQESQRQPLFQWLGDWHEDQGSHLLHISRGPRQVLRMLSDWWFSLPEPLWAQIHWFCRFACSVLDLSGSFNSSTPSSIRFPQAPPNVCHLFSSTAEWSHSDNSYARLLSASMAEYY